MSFGTIAILVLGSLFGGSLWLNLRQNKTIAEKEIELEIQKKETDVVVQQNKILTDRTRDSSTDRLSEGSF